MGVRFCVLFSLLLSQMSFALNPAAPPANLIPFNQLDAWAYRQDSIATMMRSVAEYQLKSYGQLPGPGWTTGTFYSSFIAAYRVTGDRWFLNEAQKWASHVDWQINHSLDADELCPAQTYLDLHFIKHDDQALAELDARLSKAYFNRQQLDAGEIHEWVQEPQAFTGRNLWSWADALYMAPPVLARMGRATGDPRYYQALHSLYWDAVDNLYDPEEHLLFRNSKTDSEQLRSPNDKKVFWSRGMGWVMAGLSRTLPYLDATDPKRERYLALFRELSFSLARYQQSDGLWRSAVNDPEWYATKETSGTAFFVFAMAKGINEGWLERDYFLPIVLKGWSGLAASISPGGKLGYSQLVAGSPHEVRARDSVDYAAGALILAGSEMYKLDALAAMRKLEAQQFKPQIVASDARWPALSNTPVLKHLGVFYSLYQLAGGELALSAFTTSAWPNVSAYARKQKMLSEHGQNSSAALLTKNKETVLAVFQNKQLIQRDITIPLWQAMEPQEALLSDIQARDSYLQYLLDGQLLHLYIDKKAGPSFRLSDDGGLNLQPANALFSAWHFQPDNIRMYIASNANSANKRTDIMWHVRSGEQRGLYHVYLSEGKLYSAKGSPLSQSFLQKFQALDFLTVASQLRIDVALADADIYVEDFEFSQSEDGKSGVVQLLLRENLADVERILHVTLQNKQWQQQELLRFSKKSLQEKPLTAGLSLSPQNKNTVMLASRVHPLTAQPLANNRYQIFKAQNTASNGAAHWQWQQLSFDPVRDQVAPHVVAGDVQAVFWLSEQQENTNIKNQKANSALMMSEAF